MHRGVSNKNHKHVWRAVRGKMGMVKPTLVGLALVAKRRVYRPEDDGTAGGLVSFTQTKARQL